MQQFIADEVTAALAEGRYAKREPAFTENGQRINAKQRRQRTSLRPTNRFCWTPDTTRVYLVERLRREVLVVTVLPARADSAAA